MCAGNGAHALITSERLHASEHGELDEGMMLAWSCKQHERGMMSASVVTERSEGASLLPLKERGRDACSCYRGSDSEPVVRCK